MLSRAARSHWRCRIGHTERSARLAAHRARRREKPRKRRKHRKEVVMRPSRVANLRGVLIIALLATSGCKKDSREGSTMTITPGGLQQVGAVDERYQSY